MLRMRDLITHCIREVLTRIVYGLSYIIPTRKILVFHSFPDYADNPYALYKHVIEHPKYNDYKKVWILTNPTESLIQYMRMQNKDVVVSHSVLKNWYYVLIARYIFSSHNAYGYLRFRQSHKLITLWHGMPLKKIGRDHSNGQKCNAGTITTIASSSFFRSKMASAFGLSIDKVWMVGQPRIDLLFEKSAVYDLLTRDKQYKSVGIWMPTFRQSQDGGLRDADMPQGEFNYWDGQTLEKINNYLSETSNFLILKLHPADKLQAQCYRSFSHIAILKNNDLFPSEAYQLIGNTDWLLTDYSSVCVDYEVLGKPMAFLLSDQTEYCKNRGMYIDINQLPGKIIHNLDDLKDFISDPNKYLVDNGAFFNAFKDANNCERLLQKLLL